MPQSYCSSLDVTDAQQGMKLEAFTCSKRLNVHPSKRTARIVNRHSRRTLQATYLVQVGHSIVWSGRKSRADVCELVYTRVRANIESLR